MALVSDERDLKGQTDPPKREELTEQIAQAAYFKAQRRGFEPGYELDDWLEAEAEILDRTAHPD